MKTSIGIWIIDAHGRRIKSFAAHAGKNAIGIAKPDATVVNALESASRPRQSSTQNASRFTMKRIPKLTTTASARLSPNAHHCPSDPGNTSV